MEITVGSSLETILCQLVSFPEIAIAQTGQKVTDTAPVNFIGKTVEQFFASVAPLAVDHTRAP
jgi:DNA mismatch repair protein MutH